MPECVREFPDLELSGTFWYTNSMTTHTQIPITGDTSATATITVSDKGGSLSAILKKALTAPFGRFRRLSGATVTFKDGPALMLLLDPERVARNSGVRVRRLSQACFQLELIGAETAEQLDPVTAAFLALRKAQFNAGQVAATELTAADWDKRATKLSTSS
jgi:hypothetical protein